MRDPIVVTDSGVVFKVIITGDDQLFRPDTDSLQRLACFGVHQYQAENHILINIIMAKVRAEIS